VKPRLKQRPAILQKLIHFLTALTLLLKAFDKMEHPHGYGAVITFFLVSTIYIIAVTLLHDRLHAHLRLLDASVYGIESVATGIVAWLYLQEGKHSLQWLMAFASLMFIVALIVRLVKNLPADHDHAAAAH
jgi:hypothetical protein